MQYKWGRRGCTTSGLLDWARLYAPTAYAIASAFPFDFGAGPKGMRDLRLLVGLHWISGLDQTICITCTALASAFPLEV